MRKVAQEIAIPDLPSLFPYQVKNVNNFLFRDHPENLSPEAPGFDSYWLEQVRYYIEGRWINDEGTWVYMCPKLYFYINYVRIIDEERNIRPPDFRDNEWIFSTYFMLIDGFSGFEDDEEYTCHDLVGKVAAGETLNRVEQQKIPKSCYKPDGSLKKYMQGWEYLTEFYLLKRPLDRPLGKALWENERKNGIIMTGRATGKSFWTFMADFMHEFLFSGIRSIDDFHLVNKPLNFGAGCADSRQLDRSLSNVQRFYYDMPGKYIFPKQADKDSAVVFGGPWFKRVQGTWSVGNTVKHIVKHKSGAPEIVGSECQFVALTKDKDKVAAGDRFRRIYIEEVGFQENLLDVHKANKDSLRVGGTGGKRVGSAIYLGTAGDIHSIRQPKKVFDAPAAYDMASIPNYWKKSNKRIGLFIPAYYSNSDYKDANGNTDIELAYEAIMAQRAKDREELDIVSYDAEVMFNPLNPDEMMRDSGQSILPKQAAAKQLNDLSDYDIFQRRAIIGTLTHDLNEPYGVRFIKDMYGEKKPILQYDYDDKKVDRAGAFIMYEEPPMNIPEGLYYVIYDPARQSGQSESLHSVLVYKYFLKGGLDTLEDCIVAEWIGRHDRLDDNYLEVIKIAKFFNATVFPEINEAGFVEWCRRNNFGDMLEQDAYYLEKEINPKGQRSWYRVGFRMDKRKKSWCLRRAADWLLEIKHRDEVSGLPSILNINRVFSPRLLEEIIYYNPDDNFDHISSLLGLMLLIGKLDEDDIPIAEDYEEGDYYNKYYTAPSTNPQFLRRSHKFTRY